MNLKGPNLVQMDVFGFQGLLRGLLPNLATRDEFMCIVSFGVTNVITILTSFFISIGVTISIVIVIVTRNEMDGPKLWKFLKSGNTD